MQHSTLRSLVVGLSVCTLAAGLASAQIKVKEPEKAPEKAPAAPSIPATKIKPAPTQPEAPASAPAAANAATLKVGDAAPALKADEWIKGSGVTSFEAGKVYIVEFWATWCGPCRESIPHMTQLQRKYKNDLVIVGMASSERAPAAGQPDKRVANLKEFVTKQGAKMDYHVAYDAGREMSKTWMQPAQQQYIPTAFVVSAEGKIAWINTVGGEDERKQLDKVVAEELGKAKKAAKPQTPKPDAVKPGKGEPAKGDEPTKGK